jgi:misacylated tRNA(Ala) deacylase
VTDLLYHTDAYMREFTATVLELRGQEVLLDRTAFYPGGGGQPPDEGELEWPGSRSRLAGVRKEGSGVWHAVEGEPPPPGTRLDGRLDWDRRYRLMRTHTAMHILCGVIFRQYGASVTGGQMEPLRGRMDFEFASMRQELVREIEGLINHEVEAGRPVRVRILPREEAFQIPDLIRTKVNLLPKDIQEVRTVEIEGLDLQADGGTHVSNTRDVGPLKIVDYKSKGAINKRLVVTLGE